MQEKMIHIEVTIRRREIVKYIIKKRACKGADSSKQNKQAHYILNTLNKIESMITFCCI